MTLSPVRIGPEFLFGICQKWHSVKTGIVLLGILNITFAATVLVITPVGVFTDPFSRIGFRTSEKCLFQYRTSLRSLKHHR